MRFVGSSLIVVAVITAVGTPARADEGMWLVDNFPRALVKERLNVDIDQAWLQHIRLSAVRFNSGGSGSFVSPTGLVLTNHHVGADCIAKLGSTGADYHRDGFYAKQRGDELRCPDLELNVLVGIEDVTKDVRAAETSAPAGDAGDAARTLARRSKMAALEKACADRTHERCDVVTLYKGGRYELYHYKKYVDVRLVFAPEFAVAFFGGDQDNFTYPRYDLDVAVFRAYENGKAIQPHDWLRFAAEGVYDGAPTFTAGHPGNTERLSTQTMLTADRDLVYPTLLVELEALRTLAVAYAKRGVEQERASRKLIFNLENGLKAYRGYLSGLQDPTLLRRRADGEARLDKAVVGRAELSADLASANASIARAEKVRAEIYPRWLRLEGSPRSNFTERNPYGSRLFGLARGLVRLVDEQQKPSGDRLRELGDAALPAFELQLYSSAPIDLGLEETLFTAALERLQAKLGANDPIVKAALAGMKPAARAHAVVQGTKLADVAVRKSLAASRAAQDAAHDPMLDFARAVDAAGRALRTRMENEVEGPEESALGKIARAQFAVEGDHIAPDATFTLRISFGHVAGYRENEHNIPPMTVLAGMFGRSSKSENRAPYELPARWIEHKSRLRPTQPINFVTTNDVIGGSSGSPVVDAKGELVGLVFDENQGSLPNIFGYRDGNGRAVCVHAGGILDALTKVYDAGALVDELNAKQAAP
jgi:hypothetical protein